MVDQERGQEVNRTSAIIRFESKSDPDGYREEVGSRK